MSRDTIKLGVELDRETDAELRKWSREEGRSKRRQAGILLRRISTLRRINPGLLADALRHADTQNH